MGILDRESNRSLISVAATGMGMSCLAIDVSDGRLDRREVVEWMRGVLIKTARANAGNHGWLYHFTDLSGSPAFDGEISSIDTAIYYLGAIQASRRLKDPALIAQVKALVADIDVRWMMTNAGMKPGKRFFSHGFIRRNGEIVFLPGDWAERSEGVLLYRLFGVAYSPSRTSLDLPLFTYYYPLCFYRDREWIDLLGRAIDRQRKRYGVFGITACDGPHGYTVFDPDLISPLAIASCEPFFPATCADLIAKLGVDRKVPSLQISTGWKSRDRIGIDEAAYRLLTAD